MKILMVCLGNICRSPLAEGIMTEKIRNKGLDWHVDSAGTSGWHAGERPDHRSILIARNYGIDISTQAGRQLKPNDLEDFDLILAMDSSNYNDISRLAQNRSQSQKVQLILNYVNPGANQSVPDPYWDDNGFENVFHMLDKACDKVLEHHLQEKKAATPGSRIQ